MSENSPRVSVIIPTYNRAGIIGRTIESVLEQTCPDVEVIVVDDGSADDTRQVVAAYGERVRYAYQENAGPSAARNRGVGLSQAEYIAFLDSDDIILPTKVEKQVAYLEAHPEVDVVLCGWRVVDRAGNDLGLETLSVATAHLLETILLTGSYGLFPPHVPLLRRACFQHIGGFDVSLPAREEQDFWIQAALAGCVFAMITEVLCVFIDSPDSRGKNVVNVKAAMGTILCKVFADPRLPEGVRALRDEIYGRVHLQYAFYHLGESRSPADADFGLAEKYAACALKRAPGREAWVSRYLDMVVHQALTFAAAGECACALTAGAEGDGQSCLTRLMDRLFPAALRPAWLLPELESRLYAALAFSAYEGGHCAAVPGHLCRAVRFKPSLLKERGISALLVRSLFGMLHRTTEAR